MSRVPAPQHAGAGRETFVRYQLGKLDRDVADLVKVPPAKDAQ